jgi:hypothetical protein
LAKERSLDTETKLRGGDLLYFTEDGQLVGKEDSAPINTTLAMTAFKLERTGEQALKKLMADLRAELKPEVYPERMDAIVLEPTGEPIEPPNQ